MSAFNMCHMFTATFTALTEVFSSPCRIFYHFVTTNSIRGQNPERAHPSYIFPIPQGEFWGKVPVQLHLL